jgi:dihydroorotase
VIDAAGMIVTPGLVDIHTHTAYNVAKLSVDPETACLLKGTTTVVDAGSTGELNFTPFKKLVVERSRARILAFINIESLGMVEFTADPPRNTDQGWPDLITGINEAFAPLFVNTKNTVEFIRKNRRTIVGIKWAHHGMKVLKLARDAADKIGCRLMIENHFMPDALKYVRRGDMVTHLYHNYNNPRAGYVDGLTHRGKVRPEFFEAVKRGIILDIGHGRGSFVWKIAELAVNEGIKPQTISTDLWIGNLKGPVYDMPTTMSKLLHLGMSLEEVVRASTVASASAIDRLDEIGTLKHGMCADVAIFRLRKGKFPLVDVTGVGRIGTQLLTPLHVIRGGDIVLSKGEPTTLPSRRQ